MQGEIFLTLILKIEYAEENPNRTLASLFSCKGELPFEVRAIVGKDNHTAPQILDVYRKSKERFSYSVQKSPVMQEEIAREIGKAAGKYILICDGNTLFLPAGFDLLTDYLRKTDTDAVFFDTQPNGKLFISRRFEKRTKYCTVEELISVSREKLFACGALFKKCFLEKAAPFTDRLAFDDAFFAAPLLFCRTASYLKTTVFKRGAPKTVRAPLSISDYFENALALTDFFGEIRSSLDGKKYSFLFRHARNRILHAYNAYLTGDGKGREEVQTFDEALREKNMPLYVSSGERSVLSYVEKLRKNNFSLSRLRKTAVKLCLEVQNDI